MKTTLFLAMFYGTLAFAFTGCEKQSVTPAATPTTTVPGANDVWIQNMQFSPATFTVAVNTTVQWTNKDGVAHTVTSNSSLFNSGTMNPGAVYSFKFTTAGSYPYHCSIHPSMTATIVVQ